MSQPIRLDQVTLAIVLVALFAFVGFRRGILRELVATPAILLAPAISPWLGVALTPWVNRFYRLFLFARFGGLVTDDLAAVMERVREVPPLVRTQEDAVRLGLVLFSLIIIAGYTLGQWRVKGPGDRVARLLGSIIGAVNGYALVQTLIGKVWPTQFAVVVVPLGSVAQLFHAQTAAVLVVAFMALVVLALQQTGRK